MKNDIDYLKTTIAPAKERVDSGNNPFVAMLIGSYREILIRSGNTYQ